MLNENQFGIRRQTIDANNFELKPSPISMVQQQQFRGHPSEDLNGYQSNFLKLYRMIKMGVDHDIIKLTLFSFSLKEKARNRYHNLTQGSIDTREKIVDAFLPSTFRPNLHPNIEPRFLNSGK